MVGQSKKPGRSAYDEPPQQQHHNDDDDDDDDSVTYEGFEEHTFDPRGPHDGDDDQGFHHVNLSVDPTNDVLELAHARFRARRRRAAAFLAALAGTAALVLGVAGIAHRARRRRGVRSSAVNDVPPAGPSGVGSVGGDGEGAGSDVGSGVGSDPTDGGGGGDDDDDDDDAGGGDDGGGGGSGSGSGSWGRPSLPPLPPDLSEICSPTSTSKRKGREKCEAACEPAECCFLPPSHILSCLDGNEDDCSEYESTCEVLDVEIPAAPDNLAEICSAASLRTDEGKSDCRDACNAAVCCSEPVEACRPLDDEVCAQYLPCSALYGEDPKQYEGSLFVPAPPDDLEDMCSPDAISSVDGFRTCADVCKRSLCCSEPIEACHVLNPDMCDGYAPCAALYGEDVDQYEGSVEVPPAPEKLEKACSSDSIKTAKGFRKCEKLCHMSDCCRAPLEECRVLNPEVCGDYGPCSVLHKRDGDKFRGKVEVPKPPKGVDVSEVCSKDSVGTVEGFTQCEDLCDHARCCDEKIETCQVTNPAQCESYSPCQKFLRIELDGTVGAFDDQDGKALLELSQQVLAACSYRSLRDPQGLARCDHLCNDRFCCFEDGGSDGDCSDEYECVVFSACRNLFDFVDGGGEGGSGRRRGGA